jgi:hypothetical protein
MDLQVRGLNLARQVVKSSEGWRKWGDMAVSEAMLQLWMAEEEGAKDVEARALEGLQQWFHPIRFTGNKNRTIGSRKKDISYNAELTDEGFTLLHVLTAPEEIVKGIELPEMRVYNWGRKKGIVLIGDRAYGFRSPKHARKVVHAVRLALTEAQLIYEDIGKEVGLDGEQVRAALTRMRVGRKQLGLHKEMSEMRVLKNRSEHEERQLARKLAQDFPHLKLQDIADQIGKSKAQAGRYVRDIMQARKKERDKMLDDAIWGNYISDDPLTLKVLGGELGISGVAVGKRLNKLKEKRNEPRPIDNKNLL